jgi:NAD(P)-dependent dehydrogenase (short-subunit alcohol dehydrogenase family)
MSLRGRTYAVTGANTGVGLATAMALAGRGARVLLLCRSRARAEAAVARILRKGGAGTCEAVDLDLASLSSVDRAVEALARRAPHLDALINNAGVGGARGITPDGFELAFGVNYLGHYALTRRLLHRVDRVVHLTSGTHARAERLDFRRFEKPTRSLTGVSEYAASKLCVMLFHHELARRCPEVLSVAADPGDVASDAWRHVPCPVRALIVRGMKSPEEGARTSIHCATAPGLSTGSSFVDEAPFEASPLSRDPELAAMLWERSARYVGSYA